MAVGLLVTYRASHSGFATIKEGAAGQSRYARAQRLLMLESDYRRDVHTRIALSIQCMPFDGCHV